MYTSGKKCYDIEEDVDAHHEKQESQDKSLHFFTMNYEFTRQLNLDIKIPQ